MRPINQVLLVDDDPISNIINEKIIQTSKCSMSVKSYLNASEALDYLKQRLHADLTKFPDVIFLDINMPEMNGWEFFEELNKFPDFILKECKVFMLSSSIDDDDIEKAKTYKMVYDFISKPLTVNMVETLFSTQQHVN